MCNAIPEDHLWFVFTDASALHSLVLRKHSAGPSYTRIAPHIAPECEIRNIAAPDGATAHHRSQPRSSEPAAAKAPPPEIAARKSPAAEIIARA